MSERERDSGEIYLENQGTKIRIMPLAFPSKMRESEMKNASEYTRRV